MIRPLLAMAGGLLALYLLVCVLMFVYQRSLIYLPQPRLAGAHVPTLTLEQGAERIVVTVGHAERTDAILYFGGNAEDVSSSLPALARAFPGRALYLMHYRGYGGSTGKPSESALVADALALFDRIAPAHRSVTGVGRSLGTGVVIQLAVQRPLADLILVTPYHSLLQIASDLYPWLPVGHLLQDRYESYRFAPRVTVPTRVVVAAHDDIVPVSSSDRLLGHFRPELVTRVQIPGTDHVDIIDVPAFASAVAAPGNR